MIFALLSVKELSHGYFYNGCPYHGIARAGGINLYAANCILGYLGSTGQLDLPAELQILGNPLAIITANMMVCVAFIAGKIPSVEPGWDGNVTSTHDQMPHSPCGGDC